VAWRRRIQTCSLLLLGHLSWALCLLVSALPWSFNASPRMISCSSRILFRSDSPVSSLPSLAKGDILCWTFLCHCRRFCWKKKTSTLSVGMSKLRFGTLKVVTKSSAGRAKSEPHGHTVYVLPQMDRPGVEKGDSST